MSQFKRVYHPSLDAWQDVASSDVESWSKAGWLKTRPKHVDDSESLTPGEFHVASIALDVTDEAAPAAKSDAK